MAAARGPATGRRPAPRVRTRPTRRSGRTSSRTGLRGPERPSLRRADRATEPLSATTPRGPRLTTRAAVLGLVLCAVVVSAALPLREFVSQRGQISGLQDQRREQQQRVAALEEQQRQLSDPDHIATLARQRLHYARPGETTYVVVRPGPSATAATPGGSTSPMSAAPWYSQLWESVRAADGSG